jgi:hypothetical protein
MTHYRLEFNHAKGRDSAEPYNYVTDELIARGTPEEVREVLTRLIREAEEGSSP